VADPDFELRGGGRGGGRFSFTCPAGFSSLSHSVISSSFTQNKGGERPPRVPPLDPPLRETDSKISKSLCTMKY